MHPGSVPAGQLECQFDVYVLFQKYVLFETFPMLSSLQTEIVRRCVPRGTIVSTV
jgi:hypothetical protein